MIKHVKNPAHDETFPSWLYRISVTRAAPNYSVFKAALLELIRGSVVKNGLHQNGDIFLADEGADIDYDMKLIQDVANTHLAEFRIKCSFFAPCIGLVVPCTLRSFYCPQCLRDDVASIGFPYWRKSWTYCVTAYCYQHNRLLTTARANTHSYDRAWSAFKEDMTHSSSNAFRSMRDRLAIQVQRWYFKRPGFCTLELENTHSTMVFFELTYSLLLKCRTRFEDGGYACALARDYRGKIIQKSMPLRERIQTGVGISVPLQRACALILTGTILGLISPAQIAQFIKLAKDSGVPWPSSPFDIGKMTIIYAHRDEYLELRALYAATPAHVITRCAEFFRGLEHGVYALRDEHSSEDRKWLQGGSPHLRWLGSTQE